MKPIQEQAYGIIPLRKLKDHWQVLLVLHTKGNYWGFPKGHHDPGESPKETAARELQEETGLSIDKFLPQPSIHEEYDFVRDGKPIHKKITYFLAEIKGEVSLQQAEMQSSQWVDLAQAEGVITFPQSKSILREVLSMHI